MSSDQVERYLDAVSIYQHEKQLASEAWKNAFVELAKARLVSDFTYKAHDPAVQATVTWDQETNKLHISGKSPLMQGWPPQALRSAYSQFLVALKHELVAHEANHKSEVQSTALITRRG